MTNDRSLVRQRVWPGCFIGLVCAGLIMPSMTAGARGEGPFHVETLELRDLKDSKRDGRLVPLKVHYPRKAGRYPLVIFSHGGMGTWDSHLYEAIVPDKVIKLFNGKDLSGWATWLVDTKRNDPRGVYSVQDGAIRISGDGFGYLSTVQAYKDYRLVVEVKWGERNFRKIELHPLENET